MDSRKESIRRIAFRNYESRIRENKPGDEKSDWYQAEMEYNISHDSGCSRSRYENYMKDNY